MNLTLMIINLGLIYYIYLDAQKRGAAKAYWWLILTFFVPYIGFIIYLAKRSKKIINDKPRKAPYGFRSKRPWKMVVSSVAYLLLFIFAFAAATAPNTEVNQSHSGSAIVSENNKDSKTGTNQDKANVPAPNQDKGNVPVPKQENPAPENKPTTGPKLKVHYIDVGQADSILIQTPGGKNMLVDAGNNEDANTIVSYLQSQGVQRLNVVIGTHPHEDHIGSLDTIITTFDIGQVVMPKVQANTRTYKDVITAIANKGLKITEAKAGLLLDLGPGVRAQLLAPNETNYKDLNNYSAVLKLTYGKNVFLFTGDAQDISENEILNAGDDLKADVLKVGHHGTQFKHSKDCMLDC